MASIDEASDFEIKTLKYRGPTVLALSNGNLALWLPGETPEYRAFAPSEAEALWIAVNHYIENNVLRPIKPRPAVRPPSKQSGQALLSALGLGKDTSDGIQ